MHFEIKYHMVRESAARGYITVDCIGTEDQLGDILTKSLRKVKFQELRGRIGLKNLSSTARIRGRMSRINLVCLA
jgi:hypothetical protein